MAHYVGPPTVGTEVLPTPTQKYLSRLAPSRPSRRSTTRRGSGGHIGPVLLQVAPDPVQSDLLAGRLDTRWLAHTSLITIEKEAAHLQVLVRDNNVDQALKALKKKMQREGIFREMKLRNYYEKPSEKRVREKAEAVRRARKLARKRAQREGLLPGKAVQKPTGPGGAGGRGGPGRGGPPRGDGTGGGMGGGGMGGGPR